MCVRQSVHTEKCPTVKIPMAKSLVALFITNLPTQIKFNLWTTYNKMYLVSIVPARWKTADIIPLLKPEKNPTEPKSYRPILLLSCAGKLMERMVGKRLRWYLEQNQILLPYQFGFRSGKSLLDPLAILEHEIQMSYRTQKVTIVVLLDLAAAFDKADVMAILYKLDKNGVKGKLLAWLQTYLLGRYYRVWVENKTSNTYPISSSVPQWSPP